MKNPPLAGLSALGGLRFSRHCEQPTRLRRAIGERNALPSTRHGEEAPSWPQAMSFCRRSHRRGRETSPWFSAPSLRKNRGQPTRSGTRLVLSPFFRGKCVHLWLFQVSKVLNGRVFLKRKISGKASCLVRNRRSNRRGRENQALNKETTVVLPASGDCFVGKARPRRIKRAWFFPDFSWNQASPHPPRRSFRAKKEKQ
jgi:hypothetical protein